MNPVIFLPAISPARTRKTQWLREKNIKVFYGDSDNDISAARDADARGIRVLRAANSSYKTFADGRVAGGRGDCEFRILRRVKRNASEYEKAAAGCLFLYEFQPLRFYLFRFLLQT